MSGHSNPGARGHLGSFLWILPLFLIALLVGSCADKTHENIPPESADATGIATGEDVADAAILRGEHLVTVGSCNDCHTPMVDGPNGPMIDESQLMAGHPAGQLMPAIAVPKPYTMLATTTAFTGSWGTSYAPNLTGDTTTGIGLWKAADFIQAMRSGKHWGSARPIMPPMPWQSLAKLPDEDLRAIHAYLRSIPRISNHAPEYQPPVTGGPAAPLAAPRTTDQGSAPRK